MTGSQAFSELTRQTIDDHRQIHFYLDQLERSLAGLDDGLADLETLRRLAARIDGVRERLVEHFTGEESGGLFEALVEQKPEFADRVGALTEQHRQILELLDMARVRAQYGEVTEAGVLRSDLLAFLRLAREHEGKEEALLAHAVPHDPSC